MEEKESDQMKKWMKKNWIHGLAFQKAMLEPQMAKFDNIGPAHGALGEFPEQPLVAAKILSRIDHLFNDSNANVMLRSVKDLAFKWKDGFRARDPRIKGPISLDVVPEFDYRMEYITDRWLIVNYRTNLLSNHDVDGHLDGRKFLKARNQIGGKSWYWEARSGWDNLGREAVVHSWIVENKKLLEKSMLVGRAFPQGEFYKKELRKYVGKQRRP